MKICIVMTDISNDGGTQKAVTEFVNHFYKKSDIHIISIFNSEKSNKHLKSIENKAKFFYLFKKPFNVKKNSFKILKSMKKHFKYYSYDNIIGAGIFYSTFIHFACKNSSTSKIAWCHSSYDNAKFLGLNWIGRMVAIKYFDKIITVSKRDFIHFCNNKNLKDLKKVDYVYNYSNLKLKRKKGNQNKVLLSVGTIDHVKGFDYVFDIAPELFGLYPEWQWIIIGDGPLQHKFREKVKALGLEKNIKFIGYRANLDEYYTLADIFVLTSRSEGFGYVTLEAKSYSLPIVAFSCHGISDEIIKNNFNGSIIRDGDVKEMSNEIKRLIESEAERRKYSKNCIFGNEKFNPEFITKKWESILESV